MRADGAETACGKGLSKVLGWVGIVPIGYDHLEDRDRPGSHEQSIVDFVSYRSLWSALEEVASHRSERFVLKVIARSPIEVLRRRVGALGWTMGLEP